MQLFMYIVAVLAIGAFSLYGMQAQDENQNRANARHSNLLEVKPQPTPLDLDMRGAKLISGAGITAEKFPRTFEFWTSIEADGWVLLNGERGADTCPAALRYFARQNAPKITPSPDSLGLLVSSLEGKRATFDAFVPTYKQAPAGLENCLGYSFDATTGRLKLGDRFVALYAGYRTPGPKAEEPLAPAP